MFYLKIDPVTGIAIGGVFTKEDNVAPSDYEDFRPVTGGAQIGWIWDGLSWAAPAALLVSMEDVRVKRDKLLLESDWRVSVSDYPNSDVDEWIAYRDLLRDYPLTYTPVESPVWPEEPV